VIADEIAAGGDEHEQTNAAEYRLRHRDGRIVWLRDDAQLVINADGTRGVSLLAPAAGRGDHPDAAGRSRLAAPGRVVAHLAQG
jgi:hypothetical protein